MYKHDHSIKDKALNLTIEKSEETATTCDDHQTEEANITNTSVTIKKSEATSEIKIIDETKKNKEAFHRFYALIDELFEIYVESRGSADDLFETVKFIIDARENFTKKKVNYQ